MDIINRAFADMLTFRSADDTSTPRTGNGFFDLFNGKISSKGGLVNYKKSLKLSAVWNAVDIKSDALGVIPFGVYQSTDEGRERLKDHPVDWLLNQEPDGEEGYLTPFHFKKLLGISLMLRGNCLFKIISKNNGITLVKYIAWDDVYDIKKVDGRLVYMVKGESLLSSEVLHYKLFSFDGICGVSVITYACLNLNVGLEIQEFSYTNFQNKGVRQGVIESDNVLKDDGAKPKIKAAWNSAMQEKSPDRIVVLDDGLKFKPITITPQEAQLIESGRFNIEDIARWFNVPLYKLKSLTQAQNNNVEQMAIDWLVESVQPLVTSVEQETAKKMLTHNERKGGRNVKGNMNVLLRADTKSRGEYYTKMVNSGILTPNEIRGYEELNKKEGGDELRFPVNTQTQSQIDAKMEENEQ